MTEVVRVDPTIATVSRVRSVARTLGSEVAKFGTVGAAAFVIDVGLFNLLRASVLSDSPLTAKTVSVLVATTFAFLANRHWTYRDRARTGYGRETVLFFATNAAALLISWACLATTHYLLGLDSQLADNISGNVIAVGLGTLFRFWVYRTWVFPQESPVSAPRAGDPAVSLSAPDGPDSDAPAPAAEPTSLLPLAEPARPAAPLHAPAGVVAGDRAR
jgi:putative flippase GtrA